MFIERDFFLKFFMNYTEYIKAFKNSALINMYPVCPKCKNAYVKQEG